VAEIKSTLDLVLEKDPAWTNFLDGLHTRYRKSLEEMAL